MRPCTALPDQPLVELGMDDYDSLSVEEQQQQLGFAANVGSWMDRVSEYLLPEEAAAFVQYTVAVPEY